MQNVTTSGRSDVVIIVTLHCRKVRPGISVERNTVVWCFTSAEVVLLYRLQGRARRVKNVGKRVVKYVYSVTSARRTSLWIKCPHADSDFAVRAVERANATIAPR